MNGHLIFILLVPFVFIGFFCLITYLLSIIGGWAKLAKNYPRRKFAEGRKFSLQSLAIGLTNYGNVVTVHSSREGLDLEVMLPFRFGHSPIFIPWSEMAAPREKSLLWYKYVLLEIGMPTVAAIKLPKKAYDSYRESL